MKPEGEGIQRQPIAGPLPPPSAPKKEEKEEEQEFPVPFEPEEDFLSESDASYLADEVLDSDSDSDLDEGEKNLTEKEKRIKRRRPFIDVRGGCHQLVPHEDMEDHMESECEARPHPCRYCGDVFAPASVTASHELGTCHLRPLPCPFRCSALIKAKDLDLHCSTNCPMRPVPCPLSCCASVPFMDLEWHTRPGMRGNCPNRRMRCPYGM